jgi:hypothetical protein
MWTTQAVLGTNSKERGDNNQIALRSALDWTAPEGLPLPMDINMRKHIRQLDAKSRGTLHANDFLGKSTCVPFPFVQQT